MYRKKIKEPEFENFILPFSGKLLSENRWVVYSKIIPWDEIEEKYAKCFSDSGMGAPAKSVRIALGALIIKEKLNITDEETLQQIIENPYLQYFLGFETYRNKAPFDPSMMVHFRKRLNISDLKELNELIVLFKNKNKGDKNKPEKNQGEENNGDSSGNKSADADIANKGKLIVDATCAPADIAYPTDVNLLNTAREKTEEIIDMLYNSAKDQIKKPRTYRKKARKSFVEIIKNKIKSAAKLRKAIGKQLRFIRRNIKNISAIIAITGYLSLSKAQKKNLEVIKELYRQQDFMYKNKTHRINKRIVSISQPHVRPIVRGKAASKIEFGAKISVSLIDGYCFIDKLSWEPYNESGDLKHQIDEYKRRFGYYPSSVHADKIYRTRENINYCKSNNIRFSGQKLGRPKVDSSENKSCLKKMKKQMYQDERSRIPIEGKFGNAKRKYSLARVMAKLSQTSETSIAITFLVMNLDKIARFIFLFFNTIAEFIGFLSYKLKEAK